MWLKALLSFLNPRVPAGLTWAGYALSAAGLLGGITLHPALGNPGPGSAPRPVWVGMHVPDTNRTVPANLPILANPAPLAPLAPWVTAIKPGVRPSVVTWHATGVRLTTGQDVSSTVNSLADTFGVAGVNIVAVAMAESRLNPYAERWAGGLDNSCGLMQQIITNVTAITGITNPRAACDWEEVPYNSLWYGALILAQDQQAHPLVGWPYQYVFYNAGVGVPDSFAFNPTGMAYDNLYFNFIPNWNAAQLRYGNFGPISKPTPRPKPHATFPVSQWNRAVNAWNRTHKRHYGPFPYTWHGRLSTIAAQWWHNRRAFGKPGTIDHVCGGAVSREFWFPPGSKRRLGFVKQRFGWPQKCTVFEWPMVRGAPTRWEKGTR